MTKGFILINLIALIAIVIGASACNDPRSYNQYKGVRIEGWTREDSIVFDIPRQWEGKYNLQLGIRANQNYPFKNITLIVESAIINFKNKRKQINIVRDTMNCKLVLDNGLMAGKNGVSYSESLHNIRRINLHRNDSLHIKIYHVMDKSELPGISDIGLRMVKD